MFSHLKVLKIVFKIPLKTCRSVQLCLKELKRFGDETNNRYRFTFTNLGSEPFLKEYSFMMLERDIAEPTRILEFLDLSNVHFLVLLRVTAPRIEMKAPSALESCDFGLSKITSVPR